MPDFDSKDYGDRLRQQIHADVHDRMQRKMDRWQRKMDRRAYRGAHSGRFGIAFGALIAGLGVLFLLQNLGIIYFDDIWQYWPVILIVFGVSRAASSMGFSGRVWGGVMVFVGMIFLLENLGIIHRGVWRMFWPVILIVIGLALLVRAIDRHSTLGVRVRVSPDQPESSARAADDVNRPSAWAVFSGVRKSVDSQDLQNGEVLALFGGVQLDLRHAATKQDEVVIEANAFFGGIDMTVPENWNVIVRGSAVFGGYDDQTATLATTSDVKRPRIIITGQVVFGGVTVKN